MNEQEATDLLRSTLATYRRVSYESLRERLGKGEHLQITGASGAEYQIEVQFFWDGASGGPIRVMGSIADGGWRSFVPLCESFVLGSDGLFVGEGGA